MSSGSLRWRCRVVGSLLWCRECRKKLPSAPSGWASRRYKQRVGRSFSQSRGSEAMTESWRAALIVTNGNASLFIMCQRLYVYPYVAPSFLGLVY